ncbi:Hypothetical predicted protein [Paramuricea clavata]|uniref:Uncharacterized protein n=1 Tax=Paramuricea clavata TaxID=317549 RepID=A0A7D9HR21_PARCT|nr:Hypothetical predicted protein [Paramuricea clavata]
MATKGPKLKILPFDPHGDRLNLGKRWERWLEKFERDLKPPSVSSEQWTEYRQSKEKVNQYFLPQKSNHFALFELMRVKPEEGERTLNYAARLRKEAEKCDFANWTADKTIKCLIISNLHDDQLRLICLQKELTLDHLLEKARKREDAMAMNEVHTNGRKRYKKKASMKAKADTNSKACAVIVDDTKREENAHP